MQRYNLRTGKPLNKIYLEKNLPIYLQKDIDALREGYKKQVSYIDCLMDEVQGSINSAEIDGVITEEQAIYLRKKYLYGDENKEINFFMNEK